MEEIKNDDKIKAWLGIVPSMLAAFMFALDETIANIALPHIAGSFSVSHQESIWVLTSYLIASCLTIPMLDYLVRLTGRRNMFLGCVILFTVASFLCGISNSIGMMIISRFLQGLGGGVLIPISQAIIMESFKDRDLDIATSLFGMVVIIAPILGPVLGGWITENWSWPWIYYINIPIGILVVFLTMKLIEDPPYARKQNNVKTDYWGLIFLFMFCVAFEIMMDKGNDSDWFGSPFICRLTVIWVIGLIGFIISQIKQKDSLVKFDVFKDWNYSIGTIALTAMNAILLGSMAIVPQFMQNMMGYNAFTSGLTMMPRGVGCFIGVILAGQLGSIVDKRLLAFTGILALCAGSWMLGFVNLQISTSVIVLPNILYGFGMSMGMVPLITISCSSIEPKNMSNASGLQNFIKTIGGAIGTSLVATFVSRFSQTHQHMMVDYLRETNSVYMERLQAFTQQFAQTVDISTAKHMAENMIYNQLLQQSRLWAYIDSFRIFAVLGFVILIILFFLQSEKKST